MHRLLMQLSAEKDTRWWCAAGGGAENDCKRGTEAGTRQQAGRQPPQWASPCCCVQAAIFPEPMPWVQLVWAGPQLPYFHSFFRLVCASWSFFITLATLISKSSCRQSPVAPKPHHHTTMRAAAAAAAAAGAPGVTHHVLPVAALKRTVAAAVRRQGSCRAPPLGTASASASTSAQSPLDRQLSPHPPCAAGHTCVTCTLRSRSANMPASVHTALSSAPLAPVMPSPIFLRSMPRCRCNGAV